jgi:hypothetical protein
MNPLLRSHVCGVRVYVPCPPPGFDTLDIIEGVPSLSAGRPAQEVETEEDLLLSNIFSKQKELFLQLGKQLGDERAVDRTGTFLKRVIVTRSGVLPA